ncbi:MAG: V-type ATPase 116kDa subunit family protein [Rikenellaceae bacterium]
MIVKMSKYDFVLYSGECETFIERLKELGLVDISINNWEPNEEDRNLIIEIENHSKAEQKLAQFSQNESFIEGTTPFNSGAEAFEAYQSAQTAIAQCEGEITQLEKIEAEMLPWGEFSSEGIDKLISGGVNMHFFVATESTFEDNHEAWSDGCTLEVISREEGSVYFVLIGDCSSDIDAMEVKSLSMTSAEAHEAIKSQLSQINSYDETLSRCAKSTELIAESKRELSSKLQEIQVKASAEVAADGSLLVMEGWAEEATSTKVDALLEEYPNVVYFKRNPTPEDETPVKLKNGWFSSVFEMIGNLYAVPKYGTVDLTPFFAPFYMMFFAICLCDAGYGAIILAAGVALKLKGGDAMAQASKLSMLCGAAAVVFGFLSNSFFGLQIGSLPVFANLKFIDFQTDFFNVAMYIGIIQLLFGMAINICVTTRVFGFKYALGSLGWFMLVLSSVVSFALGAMDIGGFGFDSIPYYAIIAVSAVLMLFFNSPDKNIFANFGAGIWDTYNNVTGLLGDVLSYIRLFAIGLSGGVLAQVFNSLAMGMTGLDQGVTGQPVFVVVLQIIGAVIILLLGHGINLFMSTISSFVHPMRLTFVEFYKNAGFEMGTRKFTPLKK